MSSFFSKVNDKMINEYNSNFGFDRLGWVEGEWIKTICKQIDIELETLKDKDEGENHEKTA